jgi:hypothetical protein
MLASETTGAVGATLSKAGPMTNATHVSDRYTTLPDEETLAATVVALVEHGFRVDVVDDLDAARELVLAAIASGSTVMTNASVTLLEMEAIAARERIYQHSLPLEGARAYGQNSVVGKILEIHPPCQSPCNGLSPVSAVTRGSQVAMGLGSCSPGRRSGRPSRFQAGSTRPRPPRSATARWRRSGGGRSWPKFEPWRALPAVPDSERRASSFQVSGLAVRTRVLAVLQVRVRGATGGRRGRGRRTW